MRIRIIMSLLIARRIAALGCVFVAGLHCVEAGDILSHALRSRPWTEDEQTKHTGRTGDEAAWRSPCTAHHEIPSRDRGTTNELKRINNSNKSFK